MTDASSNSPKGELFTRVYMRPRAPLRDSEGLRIRLGTFVESLLDRDNKGRLADYVSLEGGIKFPEVNYLPSPLRFFERVAIEKVLNGITLIYRFLTYQAGVYHGLGFRGEWDHNQKAERWLQFVRRTLAEESTGYTIDDSGGMHYLVDAEFDRVAESTIAAVGGQRYAGARAAFGQSAQFLDQATPDTKSSVRSAFEAVEILARLIVPEAQNLNKKMIETRLAPLILGSIDDATEKAATAQVLNGFGELVNGIHFYRHGQGVEDVVAPSAGFAVYVISAVGAMIRLLAEYEAKIAK